MNRSPTVIAGRAPVVAAVAAVVALALAACAPDARAPGAATSSVTTSGSDAATTVAARIAAQARAHAGVDDARLERASSGGWRVVIVADAEQGAQSAADLVNGLVMQAISDTAAPQPTGPSTATTAPTAAPTALPEIWLAPTTPTGADVLVLAWSPTRPEPTDGSGSHARRAGTTTASAYLSAAYRLALTPGVVRVVAGGSGGSGGSGPVAVEVARASDLAPVADVARVADMPVERITTRGGDSLTVADAPARPTVDDHARWGSDAPGAAATGPDAAPACRPADLYLSLVGTDAGLGHRALVAGATNTSSNPCALDGYPTVGFGTITHARLHVDATHGSSYMARDPGAHRVVVPPHGRALAVVSWDASSTAPGPDGKRPATAAEVRLAVAPGATPSTRPVTSIAPVPATVPGTPSTPPTDLDILDGGHVTVTAWAPGASTFG